MRRILVASLLSSLAAAASAQTLPSLPDFLQPEQPAASDVTGRVADALGNPPTLQFRKIRRATPMDAEDEVYCGQVLVGPARGRTRDFELFVYARTGESDSVRILGSNELNGLRSGRKMIGWLRRAGCL